MEIRYKQLLINGKTVLVKGFNRYEHDSQTGHYFNSNGPLRGYKRDLYEGGIRVPFIARWPGVIDPGIVSDHVSAMWDMYSTFCEVAGLKIPGSIDGISILPELTGVPQPKHEYLYWEFHERDGLQAVRMDNWKGVRYNIQSGNRDIELYNLDEDTGESDNVVEEYPEIAEKIRMHMSSSGTSSSVFQFPLDD